MDRLADYLGVRIKKQLRQQWIEPVRQFAEQAGRLHTVPLALCSGFVDHRIENIPRGLQVLSLAGLREKRDHCRPDRKAGKITKFFDNRQGIDMAMMAQKKQRFCAHTELRVSQQSLYF